MSASHTKPPLTLSRGLRDHPQEYTEALDDMRRGAGAPCGRADDDLKTRPASLTASVAGRFIMSQALGLAGELGMRPLMAHCHLGLGNLYRRIDKHQQADEQFVTAISMHREMGMTYWLEKAEAELR